MEAFGFTFTCLYGQFSFEHIPAKKIQVSALTFLLVELNQNILTVTPTHVITPTLQKIGAVLHSFRDNLIHKVKTSKKAKTNHAAATSIIGLKK